jgi:hypothetical protein
VAITPDQAPTASFTATAAAAGSPSTFDASASSVASGSITSYRWSFGDGDGEVTVTPTATHTYTAVGNYTVTLTETDSAGTSTTQVFTGQTVSRNGGAGAQAVRTLTVTAAAPSDPPYPQHVSTVPGLPAHVVISTTSVTVTASGNAVTQVACPKSALGGCRGTVTLQLIEPQAKGARARAARCARGCRPLGSAHYEARAGQKIRVRVHIASFGRRLLARRKTLRVSVIVTNVLGGRTATVTRRITLKAHARAA